MENGRPEREVMKLLVSWAKRSARSSDLLNDFMFGKKSN
jgi:hypothetical protein